VIGGCTVHYQTSRRLVLDNADNIVFIILKLSALFGGGPIDLAVLTLVCECAPLARCLSIITTPQIHQTLPWRTLPTEWPQLFGQVSANFCGQQVPRGQRA
jgi:hypothetical protein